MAFNLRLATLKLRQKLNFRLVKLLLVVIYLAATFSFIIHHVTGTKGNGAEELIVEVDTNEIPFTFWLRQELKESLCLSVTKS